MNWKYLPVVLLAGTIVVFTTSQSSAFGLRSSCGQVASCGCAPVPTCAAPCATPCATPVTTQKVMVTVYEMVTYDTTVKVCKTVSKPEKYTAYKCEIIPVMKKRTVLVNSMVPKTIETTVTRCEWVNVVENVVVTKCICTPVKEERTIIRTECVPVVEERTVTRYVTKCEPVTTMVSRCVDKGGHYECREVACSTGCGTTSHRGGLFHRHGSCDCDCAPVCAPATTTVSCYVPNLVTEMVPVTTYRNVCTPVTEKVKVTVYKQIQKPEKVMVTVNKYSEVKETVPVTRCKQVMKTEKVPCTVYECVQTPKEETYTVYEQKMTPYEAERLVYSTIYEDVKVKATRCVPKTIEKEVVVSTSACGSCGGGCGSYTSDCGGCGHRHGLLRR